MIPFQTCFFLLVLLFITNNVFSAQKCKNSFSSQPPPEIQEALDTLKKLREAETTPRPPELQTRSFSKLTPSQKAVTDFLNASNKSAKTPKPENYIDEGNIINLVDTIKSDHLSQLKRATPWEHYHYKKYLEGPRVIAFLTHPKSWFLHRTRKQAASTLPIITATNEYKELRQQGYTVPYISSLTKSS